MHKTTNSPDLDIGALDKAANSASYNSPLTPDPMPGSIPPFAVKCLVKQYPPCALRSTQANPAGRRVQGIQKRTNDRL